MKTIGDRTYADIIKNVKKNVKTKGVMINQKSKNSDGSAQLRIKGKDETERHAFQQMLTASLKNVAEVQVKKTNQTIMILDIDETVEEDEIQAIVKQELNTNEEILNLKVADKANAQGVKYAFVTTTIDAANRLINKKRIGDGWNRWRIKGTNTLKRCYKCYRVGHKANDCLKQKMELICHNCGETGHKIKECNNVTTCYLCQSKEHKAESMRCPEYKRLVQAQERRKRSVHSK